MIDETAGHTCAEGTAVTGTDSPPALRRASWPGWVDTKSDIREFLAPRRAKITPQQAGPPACGSNRRVPGLRRGGGRPARRRQHRPLRPPRTWPPRRSLRRSPRRPRAPSSSTKPDAPSCTTWPAPPAPEPRGAPDEPAAPSLPASIELPAQPGLTLSDYSAEPHTPAHDALRLPAAWAATEDTLAATTTRTEEQQS